MKKRLLINCMLLALFSNQAIAQDNDPQTDESEEEFDQDFSDDFGDEFGDFYGGDEFISIATGTQKAIDKAPAVASVITSEQIKQSGARSLADALKMIPGLHVSRNSQIMAPKFNFRGISSTFSPQTLLMINGVPTKSVVRGDNHTVWGEHPIHSISRIEIIRGPGSALYGADAFAGVINIITKDSSELANTEIGGGIGTQDTQNLWFNTGLKKGDLEIGVSAELLKSDGLNETILVDAQTPLDAVGAGLGLPPISRAPGATNLSYQSIDLFISAKYKNLKFGLSTQDRADVGTGQGAAEALDTQGRFGGSKTMMDLVYESDELADNWNFKGHINYYAAEQNVERNTNIFPPGAFFGAFPDGLIGNPAWKEDNITAEIRADYSGLSNHNITIGTGYIRQDLYQVTESKNFLADLSPDPNGLVDVSDTAGTFLPEVDRNNRFMLLQDIWQFAPDWELTSGIRYDSYSDFGSTVNPRVALVWSSSLKSTTKFLYGRAFRAPSFAETLTVNNPVSLGNPNISPETIDSLELAYTYKHNDQHSSSINVFHYSIDDFITFIPDAGLPTATAQNVGERTGYGIEAETGFSLSESLSVKANYSWVKAEDDLQNDDVGDYPTQMFKTEILWQLSPKWSLHSTANIVGERRRTPFDARADLDGYTDIGFNLRYHDNEGYEMSLSVDNLFNEDIREPSTGPAAPGGPVSIPNDLPLGGRIIMLRVSHAL